MKGFHTIEGIVFCEPCGRRATPYLGLHGRAEEPTEWICKYCEGIDQDIPQNGPIALGPATEPGINDFFLTPSTSPDKLQIWPPKTKS